MSRRTENGSRQSGARMGKDGNRSNNENYRNDYSAVAINSLCSCGLLIVIENCRDQNFDQRKENEQRADQKENVEPRHVRQARQLIIDGKTICD